MPDASLLGSAQRRLIPSERLVIVVAMKKASQTSSLGMTSHTARQLDAVDAVFSQDPDGCPGAQQLEQMAFARGVDALYQEYVRGTELDLRRQHASQRVRNHRQGLHLV